MGHKTEHRGGVGHIHTDVDSSGNSSWEGRQSMESNENAGSTSRCHFGSITLPCRGSVCIISHGPWLT